MLLVVKLAATTVPEYRLSAEIFADFLTDNDDVILLDIRTSMEYEQGHIDRAELIDYYQSDFKTKLAELDKDATYLIYCRSGNRSSNALRIMQGMGFTNFADLEGGIRTWVMAKKELVK